MEKLFGNFTRVGDHASMVAGFYISYRYRVAGIFHCRVRDIGDCLTDGVCTGDQSSNGEPGKEFEGRMNLFPCLADYSADWSNHGCGAEFFRKFFFKFDLYLIYPFGIVLPDILKHKPTFHEAGCSFLRR